MTEEARIVILGAGPAGLTTAIQLVRQGQRPRIFERNRPGGLLHNANWVENYPGFPGGISGPDLVKKFLEQATQLGVEITRATVESLDYRQDSYRIQTSLGDFSADIVVVASGTEPIPYQAVPLPQSAADKVFYEVADLASVQGRHILILGAGDAALDYALNLSRKNRVTLLNRSQRVRGLALLWSRVQQSESIQYFPNHNVVEVTVEPAGNLLVGAESEMGARQFEVDFLVPAIGRKPAKDFLTERVKNHFGQLTDAGTLYFIGDVANERYRQTAIAVGDGLRTAMQIEQKLMEFE